MGSRHGENAMHQTYDCTTHPSMYVPQAVGEAVNLAGLLDKCLPAANLNAYGLNGFQQLLSGNGRHDCHV